MKELEVHTKIGKDAKVELAIKKQQEIEYVLRLQLCEGRAIANKCSND